MIALLGVPLLEDDSVAWTWRLLGAGQVYLWSAGAFAAGPVGISGFEGGDAVGVFCFGEVAVVWVLAPPTHRRGYVLLPVGEPVDSMLPESVCCILDVDVRRV